MVPVQRYAEVFAALEIPVLFLGEPGTGKSRMAELFHQLSGRKGRLVTVNCGSLSTTLMDAELFGTERGIATGVDRTTGLVASAAGGTLFLDELGNLSLEAQSHLLLVLQTGQYYRVGGRSPEYLQARVIGATNVDLDEEVRAGRMRADFRDRLRIWLPVTLPNLGERPDEILPAFRQEMARRAVALQIPNLTWEPEVETWMLQRQYPANFRSLQEVVAQGTTALKLEGSSRLSLRHLSASSSRPSPRQRHHQDLLRALARCGGRQNQVAAEFGVHPSTVGRWIRKIRETSP